MNRKLRKVAMAALIASLYAAGTILIAPISYGIFQVRLTDALIMLSYSSEFGLETVVGVTLGNIVANFFSPYGLPDIIIGTLANFFASLSIRGISKLKLSFGEVISAIVASLEIAFLIGIILLYGIYNITPFFLPFISVLIGELVSLSIGILLVRLVKKYEKT